MIMGSQPDKAAERNMILRDGFDLFKTALSDLFFPPTCAFCEEAIVGSDAFLCDGCTDSVDVVNGPLCIQCGLPVPGLAIQGSDRCGRCLADPPPYIKARYAVYYQDAVRNALLRFKFAGGLHVAGALSQILTEAFRRHFQPSDFGLIVPVPIHRARLIHRGFNQVVVLAKKLSKETGIPLDRTCFRKIKDTPPQVGLTRAARVKNLRGSFAIRNPDRIQGQKVLLVDDVATTGSTIAEAAKTINRAGADSVDVLVLAVRMEVSRPTESHAAVATSEQLITKNSRQAEVDR
jgi:ComF family protein